MLLGAVAMPVAAAVKSPAQPAGEKASVSAKHTFSHDTPCAKYGIPNCNRQGGHVVLCRIYVERSTRAQGRYACQKLVRVALAPIPYRIVVTGTTSWNCR